MAAFVNVKLMYDYYTNQRVTPVFITEEELLDMTYVEFKQRIINEVPHLNKISSSLRLTMLEDGLEVDISHDHFNVQIRGMLEKGKTIVVKAFTFESPGLSKMSHPSKSHVKSETVNSNFEAPGQRDISHSAKRSLTLTGSSNPQEKSNTDIDEDDVRIMLPLERYAKKQKESAKVIERNLTKKHKELSQYRERLDKASAQNQGNSSVCGNCHLKIGHTKKKCDYSPCRSAYSCGILAKHGGEKVVLSTLEKDIARLERNLANTRHDIENTERAADKVMSSAPKRIEDTIIKELPDRYITFGHRNWALLNRDVALIQKHLKGQLPSRENISAILNNVVLSSQFLPGPDSTPLLTNSQRTTDHRMSSQKRVLSQDYAINFPTDKSRRRNSSSHTSTSSSFTISEEEQRDFRLALKLQQDELDNSQVSGNSCTSTSNPTDITKTEMELEFEANAAAALLQLRRKTN